MDEAGQKRLFSDVQWLPQNVGQNSPKWQPFGAETERFKQKSLGFKTGPGIKKTITLQ